MAGTWHPNTRRSVVHNDDHDGDDPSKSPPPTKTGKWRIGPFGKEYGNPWLPGKNEFQNPEPDDIEWMIYNCREYLKLEEDKQHLDHADDYAMRMEDINKLQYKLLRKIIGRREHILNDPLYQFLQHVAGTMGNTTVAQLYETDEGSRAERIQILYDQIKHRANQTATTMRYTNENTDTVEDMIKNIEDHAMGEMERGSRLARARRWKEATAEAAAAGDKAKADNLDAAAVDTAITDAFNAAEQKFRRRKRVPLNTPTLLAMVRDVNISGRIQMSPNVFQATQKMMTELSQKQGCREIGKAPLMDLINRDPPQPRLVTLLGEITAYNLMIAHQLDPRRDYKVVDYSRVMRNADDAWTRLVLLLRELGLVEKGVQRRRLTSLRSW